MTAPVYGLQRTTKGSRIAVGTENLNFGQFSCEWNADDVDITGFENEGAESGLVAINWCKYDFSGLWDAAVPPYNDPPGLFPRHDLQNLTFYENTGDDVFWQFPYGRLFSSKNDSATSQKLVNFATNGKSNGGWLSPVTPVVLTQNNDGTWSETALMAMRLGLRFLTLMAKEMGIVRQPLDDECEVRACHRRAEWFTGDNQEVEPERFGGKLFSRGLITRTHAYCSWHYRLPIDVSARGVENEMLAINVRPLWASL